MAEVVVTFFLLAAVMMVTALLFGGWLIVSIIRLMFRAVGAVFKPLTLNPIVGPTARAVICSNTRCRGANPATARFCRKCGVALQVSQRVAVRRAAMW